MFWWIVAILVTLGVGYLAARNEDWFVGCLCGFGTLCIAILVGLVISIAVSKSADKVYTETKHNIYSLDQGQNFLVGVTGSKYFVFISDKDGKVMTSFDITTPIREQNTAQPYYIERRGKIVGWVSFFTMITECDAFTTYILVLPTGYKTQTFNKTEAK